MWGSMTVTGSIFEILEKKIGYDNLKSEVFIYEHLNMNIFGTLNTLRLKIEVYKPNYYSLCYTLDIISLPPKILQWFLMYTLLFRVELLRMRNRIFKIKHKGQPSDVLWILHLLNRIAVWEWHSYRWKETDGTEAMCSPKWGLPKCNVLGRWFSDLLCFVPNVEMLEFLALCIKYFPNIWTIGLIFSKIWCKINVTTNILWKTLS